MNIMPDAVERARDEAQLFQLALWDAGWSAGQIAHECKVSRNAVVAFVGRVHAADPTALSRGVQRIGARA